MRLELNPPGRGACSDEIVGSIPSTLLQSEIRYHASLSGTPAFAGC
jgi:hypothetical protein